MELSITAAKEQTRLATEIQILALETLHESHSAAMRRLSAWPEISIDPLHLYHRGCLEALDSAQRTLMFMGTTARLVTQSSERMQTAAMDAGRRVREALESSSGLREGARRQSVRSWARPSRAGPTNPRDSGGERGPPPVESGGALERVGELEHAPFVLVTPHDLQTDRQALVGEARGHRDGR